MNGHKARSLRKAVARYEGPAKRVDGYQDETWHYADVKGTERVGPSLRKLYQIAKRNYLKALRNPA